MTSRPSAFETRLAVLAAGTPEGSAPTATGADLDPPEVERRLPVGRFLSVLGLAGAAFGVSAYEPELSPVCLAALAAGLAVMAIIARLERQGMTSMTWSLKHANAKTHWGAVSFRGARLGGTGRAATMGLQRMMIGLVAIAFGVVAIQSSAVAQDFLPTAKSFPLVGDFTGVVLGWSQDATGELSGVVALHERAGHAGSGCGGTRTTSAKWICLLDRL